MMPRSMPTSPASPGMASPALEPSGAPSPIVQDEAVADDHYGLVTSPSYTPHQTHPSGAVGALETEGVDIAEASDGLEDAMSSLFEASDEEMDLEYAPPEDYLPPGEPGAPAPADRAP